MIGHLHTGPLYFLGRTNQKEKDIRATSSYFPPPPPCPPLGEAPTRVRRGLRGLRPSGPPAQGMRRVPGHPSHPALNKNDKRLLVRSPAIPTMIICRPNGFRRRVFPRILFIGNTASADRYSPRTISAGSTPQSPDTPERDTFLPDNFRPYAMSEGKLFRPEELRRVTFPRASPGARTISVA